MGLVVPDDCRHGDHLRGVVARNRIGQAMQGRVQAVEGEGLFWVDAEMRR